VLTLADPPLASWKELSDGTYSIDDVVDMLIGLQWKADQIKKSQAEAKN